MSDWPPNDATPPGDRVNLTPMANNHPEEHNAVAGILSDIIGTLGADPAGAYTDVTQRLATDPLLNELGIFTDATARDAGIGGRLLAYLTDTDETQCLRNGEWVTISRKVTVSDTPPASPAVGDLWGQPVG